VKEINWVLQDGMLGHRLVENWINAVCCIYCNTIPTAFDMFLTEVKT
jgi:hypothetical protein